MPDIKFHNISSNTSKVVMILKTCNGRTDTKGDTKKALNGGGGVKF